MANVLWEGLRKFKKYVGWFLFFMWHIFFGTPTNRLTVLHPTICKKNDAGEIECKYEVETVKF